MKIISGIKMMGGYSNKYSNNNLTVKGYSRDWSGGKSYCSHGKNKGKFYWEVSIGNASYYMFLGLTSTQQSNSNDVLFGYGGQPNQHTIRYPQVWGFALDMDKRKFYKYKDNVLFQTHDIPETYTTLYPCVLIAMDGSNVTFNFGDTNFKYNPPSGFIPYNCEYQQLFKFPFGRVSTRDEALMQKEYCESLNLENIILSMDGNIFVSGAKEFYIPKNKTIEIIEDIENISNNVNEIQTEINSINSNIDNLIETISNLGQFK